MKVDTATLLSDWAESVKSFQTASGTTAPGPYTVADVKKAVAATEGLQPQDLVTHTAAASGWDSRGGGGGFSGGTYGGPKDRIKDFVIEFGTTLVATFAGDTIAKRLTELQEDIDGDHTARDDLEKSAQKCSDSVGDIDAVSDSFIEETLTAAIFIVDLLVLFISRNPGLTALVHSAISSAAELISSTNSTLVEHCEERDKAIDKCYEKFEEECDAVCGRKLPAPAPGIDPAPSAKDVIDGSYKDITKYMDTFSANRDCEPDKKETAKEATKEQPKKSGPTPAPAPAPQPSAAVPAVQPCEDVPATQAPEPAKEKQPTPTLPPAPQVCDKDVSTTPQTKEPDTPQKDALQPEPVECIDDEKDCENDKPQKPVPAPEPKPEQALQQNECEDEAGGDNEEKRESPPVPDKPVLEPVAEKQSEECADEPVDTGNSVKSACTGVLGAVGVGVAIVGIGLLIDAAVDFFHEEILPELTPDEKEPEARDKPEVKEKPELKDKPEVNEQSEPRVEPVKVEKGVMAPPPDLAKVEEPPAPPKKIAAVAAVAEAPAPIAEPAPVPERSEDVKPERGGGDKTSHGPVVGGPGPSSGQAKENGHRARKAGQW